jgi:hypothetical protein
MEDLEHLEAAARYLVAALHCGLDDARALVACRAGRHCYAGAGCDR